MTSNDKDLFRTILGAILVGVGDKGFSAKEILIIAGSAFENIKSAAESKRPDECSEEIWDNIQIAILGS